MCTRHGGFVGCVLGVFAPHHHLRAAVVPQPTSAAANARAPDRRFDWAYLMKRVFAIDVRVCDACGGAMQILAVLPEGDATRALLEHLGLPVDPPRPRAHAPPELVQPATSC